MIILWKEKFRKEIHQIRIIQRLKAKKFESIVAFEIIKLQTT